jgi:hypothetical protein
MYDISKCKKISLPQGAMYLGPSNEEKSVGYLELKPHSSLNLHNRPIIENLTQVKERCEIITYIKEKNEIFLLSPKDELVIKSYVWHIHINPYDKISLTYWVFNGNISKIIKNIQKSAL